MTDSNLIIIVGQEGAGKSTTVRALVKALPESAQIDAEDVGEVNPWRMDEAYLRMLWKNVADLTRNFWGAGYRNVVAGSFVSNIEHYRAFRDVLNMPANVHLLGCSGQPYEQANHDGYPSSNMTALTFSLDMPRTAAMFIKVSPDA